jgi:GxxExxY protein
MTLEKIIRQIACDVYTDLGSGHDEKVYQRAMEVDLRLRGIKYDSERVLELRYKDHYVGENYADLIVRHGDEVCVLELSRCPGADRVSVPFFRIRPGSTPRSSI